MKTSDYPYISKENVVSDSAPSSDSKTLLQVVVLRNQLNKP